MGEACKERLKNAKMINSHRFGRMLKVRITNLAWIIVKIIETEPYKGPVQIGPYKGTVFDVKW